ncbi:hypothetical protein [Acetivibrio clariflavus]|uniref:hypothetical protein n=1 Tax=Acetivibrio clariflavus TaxID=288965 RepID=UPI0004ADD17A|nr:hypothetical protein [Acetivibrio clariflavus]
MLYTWFGQTVIHLFLWPSTFLSSTNPRFAFNPAKNTIDKRTVGFKRRQNALATSPESALSMLEQAGCYRY